MAIFSGQISPRNTHRKRNLKDGCERGVGGGERNPFMGGRGVMDNWGFSFRLSKCLLPQVPRLEGNI